MVQVPSITLDELFLVWHNHGVAWQVEGTDEFAGWFEGLNDEEQVSVGRVVELLVEHGPSLPFPYSSGIATSRHRHMRELRIQHEGRPYRVLYAFDPRRAAILLLGGDRPEKVAGTTNTFQLPTSCMTNTSGNWSGKD
jgi:hypothetical protein